MGGRRGFTHGNIQPTPGNVSPQSYTASLRRAVQAYDDLLLELRRQMGGQERVQLDNCLVRIRRTLPAGVLEQRDQPIQDAEDISQSASPSSIPEEQPLNQPHQIQGPIQPFRNPWMHERSGRSICTLAHPTRIIAPLYVLLTDNFLTTASEPSSSQYREIRPGEIPNVSSSMHANFPSASESYVPASTAAAPDLDASQIPFDFSQYSWPLAMPDTSIDWSPQFVMPEFENEELPWDFESTNHPS